MARQLPQGRPQNRRPHRPAVRASLRRVLDRYVKIRSSAPWVTCGRGIRRRGLTPSLERRERPREPRDVLPTRTLPRLLTEALPRKPVSSHCRPPRQRVAPRPPGVADMWQFACLRWNRRLVDGDEAAARYEGLKDSFRNRETAPGTLPARNACRW